jgi:hypothetical protein
MLDSLQEKLLNELNDIGLIDQANVVHHKRRRKTVDYAALNDKVG